MLSKSTFDFSNFRAKDKPTKSNKQLTWPDLCQLNQTLLRRCPELRGNKIKKEVQEAVHNSTVDTLVVDSLVNGRCSLNPDNYIDTLMVLLYAEEYYESVDMRRHDQFDRYLKLGYSPYVMLPGLSKGQPSLIAKDLVVLNQRVACEISYINGDRISFERPTTRVTTFGNHFEVYFVSSGVTYQRYQDTLMLLKCQPHLLRRMFFDEESHILDRAYGGGGRPKIDVQATTRVDQVVLQERLDKCNERQRRAIVGILEAKCRPKAYILFGPPGTGKSFTLVEAVLQICGRNPRLRVLVCANSNNCADQLFAAISRKENAQLITTVARLSSQAHHGTTRRGFGKKIDFKILLGTRPGQYQVMVTTNNMAGALKRYGGFDYVLIDEAGHGHEAEILVPASLLKTDGCLVLAGDPKQLGPVIHCQQVERLGLGQSMLERMFQFDVYARDPEKGYDNNYITKLTQCYRCDPRILELSNKLFYHDELRCLRKTPPSLLRALNVSHPLLFCPVEGSQDRIQGSTSIRNHQEAQKIVDIIVHYHKIGIDPNMIGVISFYTLQQMLIKSLLTERIGSEISAVQKAKEEGKIVGDDLDILTIKAEVREEDKQEEGEEKEEEEEEDVGDILSRSLKELDVAKEKDPDDDDDIRVSKDLFCKVDTVDGFQGQEREIIIISTVRCPDGSSDTIKNCGFLADSKRFNVALSRAKWLAIVVGHQAVLDCHENWLNFKGHKADYKFKETKRTE